MAPKTKHHDDDLHPEILKDMAAPAAGASVAQAKKRNRASYDLRRETIGRIDALAKELEVNKYHVVQRLLDYAIEQLDAGNLKLERVPVVSAWGLKQ